MNTIIAKGSWKKTALFTAVFILLYILINFSAIGVAGLLQITDGASILDFEFGYAEDKALAMLTAMGELGRDFYLTKIIPIDFLFPLSYMLCYMGWIAMLVKDIASKGRLKYLLLIPFFAMLFDWTENIGIIFMLKKYPSLPEWAVMTASTAGILKMICIVMSVLTIAVLLVVFFVKRKRGM